MDRDLILALLDLEDAGIEADQIAGRLGKGVTDLAHAAYRLEHRRRVAVIVEGV